MDIEIKRHFPRFGFQLHLDLCKTANAIIHFPSFGSQLHLDLCKTANAIIHFLSLQEVIGKLSSIERASELTTFRSLLCIPLTTDSHPL